MGAASGSLGMTFAAPTRAAMPGGAGGAVLPVSPQAKAGPGSVPVPGLLVDPDLLAGRVVVFVGFVPEEVAEAEAWVAALGGRAIHADDLRSATRLLDPVRDAAAAVILRGDTADGGAAGLAALGRLRAYHPRLAILRAIGGLRLNDFGADRPLDRDAALRLPFRPAAFRLGLAQAMDNARRRQGIAIA